MLEMAKNENGAKKKKITLIITAFCSEHSNFCKAMVVMPYYDIYFSECRGIVTFFLFCTVTCHYVV